MGAFNSVDFNTLANTGVYRVTGTCEHAPVEGASVYGICFVLVASNYTIQLHFSGIANADNNHRCSWRGCVSETWSAWQQL